METLTQEICRALRAHRSQVQLARALGYRSNVPASWESGRSAPQATTFFSACERLGVPVRDGLVGFVARAPTWLDELGTVEGVSQLITSLRGSSTTLALAERTGISRHALGRWQRGEAEPRLPDLLRVVRHGTDRLLDFVNIFVDPGELPSMAEDWRRLVDGRRLLVRAPWVQPVLLSLELAPYQALSGHDDGWIARRLCLPVERVVDAIAELSRTEQIAWTGTHWALHNVRTIDTRSDTQGVLSMRAWFTELGLRRLRRAQPDALFSHNLFTVSDADLERLRELHVAHFREVQALVAASEPGERVVLLQRWLVPLDSPGQPAAELGGGSPKGGSGRYG